jgi:uncharacterized protein YciI
MPHFIVINEQGPAWDPARAMREQAGWADHATFMNALEADHVVVLGGPIGGAPRHRAMLVLRGDSVAALRARLEADPWMRSGVLRLGEILPWEPLLGNLP